MIRARHPPAARVKRQQGGGIPVITGSITGPITFTVRSTITPVSISSAFLPTTALVTSLAQVTQSSKSSSSSTSSSAVSSSSSPSSSSSSAQVSPTIGPGGSGQDNATTGNNDPSNSNGISGGAIAGIVIGIILLLLILAFFLFRRRQLQRRQASKSNAPWLAKGGIEGGANGVIAAGSPYSFSSGIYAEKFTVPTPNAPPLQPIRGPYYPYNSGSTVATFIDVPISPRTVPPVSVPPNVPVTPTTNAASSLVTVRCTFVPTMQDELQITPGDTLRILQWYDDGWASCIKTSTGEEGMVPVECFEPVGKESRPTIPEAESDVGFSREPRVDKRDSSLVGNGRI
ncbi:hypothetical protein VKT23_010989 [Stygiomarasmius scandens]|uniref:SH3 domain-containing protein n=1 Tax=Marasmiellus scandens TaxID=2682957 RepID=A0ABR1JD03_9AGAR